MENSNGEGEEEIEIIEFPHDGWALMCDLLTEIAEQLTRIADQAAADSPYTVLEFDDEEN